jgi:hypothetical protein
VRRSTIRMSDTSMNRGQSPSPRGRLPRRNWRAIRDHLPVPAHLPQPTCLREVLSFVRQRLVLPSGARRSRESFSSPRSALWKEIEPKGRRRRSGSVGIASGPAAQAPMG